MLLALAVLLLVALGVLAGWVLTHRAASSSTTVLVTTAPTTTDRTAAPRPAKVAVPRLVGLKEQQAIVRLSQIGLRPKEILRQTKQPSHTVVAQKPKEATEVRRGSPVTLVVDSGAPKVVVPGLTGMKIADAQAKLAKLGLKASTTPVTSDQPVGTVVDQAPEAGGKLVKGSAVTVSVARRSKQTTTVTATTTAASNTTTTTAATTTAAAPSQPQNATMPNVQGQTEASAAQAMAQAGILPSIVFVPSKDSLGTVEQQAKPSGTTVPYHGHVQINVSTGPGTKPQESVPNAIGRTLPDAVSAMQGAHLRLIYVKLPVTSRAQAGKIVQQSPLAGAQAPQNAQILVFLGAFRG